MGAMAVVVMLPVSQGCGALSGVLIRPAVGPLAQGRLNEPLGLAVGLGTVGPSEAVADAQINAGLAEVA